MKRIVATKTSEKGQVYEPKGIKIQGIDFRHAYNYNFFLAVFFVI